MTDESEKEMSTMGDGDAEKAATPPSARSVASAAAPFIVVASAAVVAWLVLLKEMRATEGEISTVKEPRVLTVGACAATLATKIKNP